MKASYLGSGLSEVYKYSNGDHHLLKGLTTWGCEANEGKIFTIGSPTSLTTYNIVDTKKHIYTITKTERQSVNQSASIREDTIGHYWLPVLLPVNELSLLNSISDQATYLFIFSSLYPLSLCLHIYQKGGDTLSFT